MKNLGKVKNLHLEQRFSNIKSQDPSTFLKMIDDHKELFTCVEYVYEYLEDHRVRNQS